MKRLSVLLLIVCMAIPTAGFSAVVDEFSDLISSIDIRASTDIGGFKASVSAEFGTGVPKVEAVLSAVKSPGDAYMVLQLSNITKKPPEVIIEEYRVNKDKGWGAMAKNLGIKPGSPEFHALKQGKYGKETQGGGKAKGGAEKKGGKEKGGGKKK